MVSRLVADDSLSLLQIHRVGLETTSMSLMRPTSPVKSRLQNNCTVLGIEFEAIKRLIPFAIPDLDLLQLSLWLADLKGGPVVA